MSSTELDPTLVPLLDQIPSSGVSAENLAALRSGAALMPQVELSDAVERRERRPERAYGDGAEREDERIESHVDPEAEEQGIGVGHDLDVKGRSELARGRRRVEAHDDEGVGRRCRRHDGSKQQ